MGITFDTSSTIFLDGTRVTLKKETVTLSTLSPSQNLPISLTDNYLFFKASFLSNTGVSIMNLTNSTDNFVSVSGENVVAAITNDVSYCAVYDSSNNVNVYDTSDNTKYTILENNSSTQIDISNANIEISDDGLTIASHQATSWDLSTNAVELLFNTLKDHSANITHSGNSSTVQISIDNIKVLNYNILIDSSNLYFNSESSTPYIELVFKNTNLFGDPTTVHDVSKTLVELNVHTHNNGSVYINNPLTTLITIANKEGITKLVSKTNSPDLGSYFTHVWQGLDINFGITIESLNVGCIACSYYNDSSFNSNILIYGIDKIADSTNSYDSSGTGNLPAISVFKTEVIQTKVLTAPPTHMYKKWGTGTGDYLGMIMAINDDATFIAYSDGWKPIQYLFDGGRWHTSDWKTAQIGSNLSVARINSTSPHISEEVLSTHTGTSTWDYVKNNPDYNLTRQLDEIEKRINQYDGSANAVVSKNELTRAYIGPENPGYLIIDTRNNNTDGWGNAMTIVTGFTHDYIINLDHNGKTLVFAGREPNMITDGKIFIYKSEKNWGKLLDTHHSDHIVYKHHLAEGTQNPDIALNGKGDTLLVTDGGGPYSTGAKIYKINNNSFELFHTMGHDTIPGTGTTAQKGSRGIYFAVAFNKDYTFIASTPWDDTTGNNNLSSISLFSSFRFQTERDILTNTFPTNIHSSQAIPITVQDLSSGYTKFHVSSSDDSLLTNNEVVAYGQTGDGADSWTRNYQIRPKPGFHIGDTLKIKLSEISTDDMILGFVPWSDTPEKSASTSLNGVVPYAPFPEHQYCLHFYNNGLYRLQDSNALKSTLVAGDIIDFKIEKDYIRITQDTWMLASGSSDNTIKLWSTQSDGDMQTLSGHTGIVYAVAFSPDGKLLASASNDKTIKLWSTQSDGTYTEKQSLGGSGGHTHWVRAVAFSPDGKLLASGSVDDTIRLWSTQDDGDYTVKQILSGHISDVYAVAFSPDGKLLASGSYKEVNLWSIQGDGTYTVKQTLSGHTHWVVAVAFSPDGKLLASGSNDNKIMLWSAKGDGTYTVIKTLSGHSDEVRALAFRPLCSRPDNIITDISLNIKPPLAFEYNAHGIGWAPEYKIVRESKIIKTQSFFSNTCNISRHSEVIHPEKPLFALSAAGNCLAINNQSTVEIYDYSFNKWFNTYTIKDICDNATEIIAISMKQKDNLLIKYNTYNRYIDYTNISDNGSRSDIYRRDSSSNWNKESILEEGKVIEKLSKFGSRVIQKNISPDSLQITQYPSQTEIVQIITSNINSDINSDMQYLCNDQLNRNLFPTFNVNEFKLFSILHSNDVLYEEKHKYIATPNVPPRIVNISKEEATGSVIKFNVTVNQSGTLYYAVVLTNMVKKTETNYIFRDNNYINELITIGNNNIESTYISVNGLPDSTNPPSHHIFGVRRTRIEMTHSPSVELTINYNNLIEATGVSLFAFFVSNNLLLNNDFDDGTDLLNNAIIIKQEIEINSTGTYHLTKNAPIPEGFTIPTNAQIIEKGSITFTNFGINGYHPTKTYLYAAVDLSTSSSLYNSITVKNIIESYPIPSLGSWAKNPKIELLGNQISELSGVFIKQITEAANFDANNFDITINPFLKINDKSTNENLDYNLYILPFKYDTDGYKFQEHVTNIPFKSPDFSGPILTIIEGPTGNINQNITQIKLTVDEPIDELLIGCFPSHLGIDHPPEDNIFNHWIKNTALVGTPQNMPKQPVAYGQNTYLLNIVDGSGIGGIRLTVIDDVTTFDISGLYHGIEYDIFILAYDSSNNYFKTVVNPVSPQVQPRGSRYYHYKYFNQTKGSLNKIDISLNFTKITETTLDVDLSFNTDIQTFDTDGSGELYYFYNENSYDSLVTNSNHDFQNDVLFNITRNPNSTPQQNITLQGLEVDKYYNFYFYYKIKGAISYENVDDGMNFAVNSFSFHTNNFNQPSLHKEGIGLDSSISSITLKDISSSENGKILFKISENHAGITSFKIDISNSIDSIIDYSNNVIHSNGFIPDTSSNRIHLNDEDTSGTSWIVVNEATSYDISFTGLKDISGGKPYYISMVPIDDFIKPQNKGGSNSLLKQIYQTPNNPLVGQDISFVIYTKDKTRPNIHISKSDPSGTYVIFDVSSSENVRFYFDISTTNSFQPEINPQSETDFKRGYTEISGNLDTINTFTGDNNESITVSGGAISINTNDSQSIFIDICGNLESTSAGGHKKFTIFHLNLQDHPDVEGNIHTVNKTEQTYYYRYYAIDYTHNSEFGTQGYSLTYGNKTEAVDLSFITMDISAADIFVDICNNNFSEVSGNIDISTNEDCKIYIKVDSLNSYSDLTEAKLISDISTSAIHISTTNDISLNLSGLIDSSTAIVFDASKNPTYTIIINGLYPQQSEGKNYYITFMTFDGFNRKILEKQFKTPDLTSPNIYATPSSEIFFDASGILSFDVSSNENGQIIAFGVRDHIFTSNSSYPESIRDYIINDHKPNYISKFFINVPILIGTTPINFDVAFDVIDVSSSNTRPDLNYNINLDVRPFSDTEDTSYSIYIYAEDKANNFSTSIHFDKENGRTSQIVTNFTVNMTNPQKITDSEELKQEIGKEIRKRLLDHFPVLIYANPIVNIKQGSLIIELILTVNDELRLYVTETLSLNLKWDIINRAIPGIITSIFVDRELPIIDLGFQNPQMEDLSIDVATGKLVFETLTTTTTTPVQGTADPYLTTIYGKTYKLDDFNGFVRLLQGIHNDKLFTMNAETKVLTDLQYRELQSWRQEEIKGRTFSDNNNNESRPAYFTKLFIQYGDQEVSIDLETVNIINSNYNAKLYASLSLEQEYIWSEKKSLAAIADLVFGDIKLIIKRFQNKEIRCGFEIVNASLINDRSGALENTIYTKDMQIDNLTSLRPISRRVNRKEKRFTREEFIGNKKESLIVDIPIY